MAATSSGSLVTIGEIRNYRINATETGIPLTSFDSSGYEETGQGTRSCEVTMEAVYVTSTATDATQADILDAFTSQGTRYLDVRPTTAAIPSVTGDGRFMAFDIGGDIDSPAILNATLKYTGSFTINSTST